MLNVGCYIAYTSPYFREIDTTYTYTTTTYNEICDSRAAKNLTLRGVIFKNNQLRTVTETLSCILLPRGTEIQKNVSKYFSTLKYAT